MLVVKRKREDDLVIDDRIVVKVLQIGKESVRLGVMAPPEVPVHRGEVWAELIDALPVKTPTADSVALPAPCTPVAALAGAADSQTPALSSASGR